MQYKLTLIDTTIHQCMFFCIQGARLYTSFRRSMNVLLLFECSLGLITLTYVVNIIMASLNFYYKHDL